MERPAYDTPTFVNPTPGAGYGMSPRSTYASPGLRVVGGLIDVVIVGARFGAVEAVTRANHAVSGTVDLVLASPTSATSGARVARRSG